MGDTSDVSASVADLAASSARFLRGGRVAAPALPEVAVESLRRRFIPTTPSCSAEKAVSATSAGLISTSSPSMTLVAWSTAPAASESSTADSAGVSMRAFLPFLGWGGAEPFSAEASGCFVPRVAP